VSAQAAVSEAGAKDRFGQAASALEAEQKILSRLSCLGCRLIDRTSRQDTSFCLSSSGLHHST